ncbi:short chain dehydrogenase [Flammula alnicola]|nr:short chain dehydrogenase [Flammula alnicola]KAF8959874.1 short chain dehydrogenase [Flammula alnicola]
MASQLVWLITGTSSGLGRQLALEALKRGEKVIATGRARSIAKLEDLKAQGADILELDVTSPLEELQEVAKKAVAIHGRIDVLVNNAGYILVGALEESTPQETLDQFNTNVFGALNVARAFLPYMREKRTGTIIWLGSIAGWTSAPYAGLYSATKWALRGISETLNEEISPLGLRSICFDFGYFRTSFLQPDQRAPKVARIPDYKELSDHGEAGLQAYNGKQPGNPLKGVEVIVDVVRGEGQAAGKAFPVGLALGTDCYNIAKTVTEKALGRLEEWQEVSFSTDFKD